jgi:hypothetical protein
MKKLICLSLFAFVFILINAQTKTYIRFDIGLNRPIVGSNLPELSDDFNPPRLISGYDFITGLYLGHSIFKNLAIELGVNYQAFSNRYTVMLDSFGFGGCSGASKNAFIIIPLNAKYKFNLLNSKYTLTPNLGVSYIGHLHTDQFRTDITFDNLSASDNFSIEGKDTTTAFTTRPATNYSLVLNTGIGFEYRISKSLGITLNVNYSFGFKEINRFVVLIKRENNDNFNGNLSYKGTNIYLTSGIKIYL